MTVTLLPRREAAAYLRRSARTLDKYRKLGWIKHYTQDRNVFFAKEDLDAWLETRKAGSSESASPTTYGSPIRADASISPRSRGILEKLRNVQHASTPTRSRVA